MKSKILYQLNSKNTSCLSQKAKFNMYVRPRG